MPSGSCVRLWSQKICLPLISCGGVCRYRWRERRTGAGDDRPVRQPGDDWRSIDVLGDRDLADVHGRIEARSLIGNADGKTVKIITIIDVARPT